MATTTITALTAVTSGNLTGAAVAPVDDSLTNTRKTSLAQLRTNLLAGGTGFTAADPLTIGAVTASGDTGIGVAALATSATTPFLWVPSTSGTPTGVPSASMGGAVPLVVDTAGAKLYARLGGSWTGITIGGAGSSGSDLFLSEPFFTNYGAL